MAVAKPTLADQAEAIEEWRSQIRELQQRIDSARRSTGVEQQPAPPQASAARKLARKVRIRLAVLATRKRLSPQTAWVLETGLFDAHAYARSAGLGRVRTVEAASHYASVGESRGLRPSPHFDPELYAVTYPELLDSDMGLLVHYARHGAAEGRVGSFDIDASITSGGRGFDPDKPTMVVACHAASRTGAPILGWNLVRAFGRSHNVVAVLLRGGELAASFLDDAAVLAGPFGLLADRPGALALVVRELCRRYPIEVAIVNSIECHPLLFGLAEYFVPTVTLVHEFPTSVYPPGSMTAGLMMSGQVVFDADVQRRSALDDWPGITGQNQSVFHQGASEVPRARASPAAAKAGVPTDVRRLVRGAGDRPVVLGLGTISMRKGVDLFIAIAQLVAEALGPDAVRFVWIGDVPRHHPEGVYCDWLADQIRRGGLSTAFHFVDPVDDLTEAYAAAAVLVSSSRLDPFPNVAMDAALAGVPVVCFDRANGFAEFLRLEHDTARLAVPYLDVAAAARCVLDLLADEAERSGLGRRLKARSERDFAMTTYVDRLKPLIETSRSIAAQERLDTEVLVADPTFSPELWLNPHETMSRERAIRFHVRKAASGQEANQYCRRPALGFVPQTYAEHHGLDAPPFENPLAHWIRGGKPEGEWSHPVLIADPSGPQPRVPQLRTALHLHLHYPELAGDLLRRLCTNASRPDLFVSTTSDAKAADLAQTFASYGATVALEVTPNQGRDIGPLLTRFADRLLSYDVVGHLHGKRSLALASVGLGTELGVQWHEFLLQHLLGDRVPMIDVILGRFAEDPTLGLVFPEDPNLTGWSLDREIALDIAARIDPALAVPRFIDFPVGTMFWARPQALKPLFDLRLDWTDYPPEPLPIDGTMLHALERLLPVVCRHAGYTHATTHVPGVTR